MEEILNLSSSGDTGSESTQLQKPITVQVYEKSKIAPAVLGSSRWKMDDLLGEMQLLLHHIQKEQDDPKQEHESRHVHEAKDETKSARMSTSTPGSIEKAPPAKQTLQQQVKVKVMKFFSGGHRDGGRQQATRKQKDEGEQNVTGKAKR